MKYNFTDLVTFSGKACPSFEGEKIYVSTGCLHTDLICKNETELVNYSNKPSRANLVAKPGDILFAKMQSTKKNIILSEETANYVYSTGFYAIRANKNLITNKCLYYLISSDIFLTEKDKNCSGATQKAITNEGLKKIQINIPSIEIQKNIEKQLDTVSDSIKRKETQLKKLDDLVKARFVEMFFYKYQTFVVGEKLRTVSGGTPSKKHPEYYENGTIPWLTSGEVGAGIIRNVKNKITEDAVKNSSAKMVPENSVLVAMYGATAGQVGLLKVATTTNQAVCSILPNNNYLPEYLYYAISQKKGWMMSQCAGGAQPNISQAIIRKMELVDAPIESQKVFVHFANQVDKSKFVLQKSLEKTQLLFDSLMWEYFGQ